MASTLIFSGLHYHVRRKILVIFAIFSLKRRDWFETATDMKEKWGVPIHVPMAIMYQESSFKAKARPPKDYFFFGLIPWGRVSSALWLFLRPRHPLGMITSGKQTTLGLSVLTSVMLWILWAGLLAKPTK